MEKIILSPPFSNIKLLSNYKGTSRITGSYTLYPRPGLHRVLTTLRKSKAGWINNVGLRNPGILSANSETVSIAGLESGDYELMLYILDENPNVKNIEFNISCPNAEVNNIRSDILYVANQCFDKVVVKLPHNISDERLFKLLDLGEFIPHVSNTKVLEEGALSGIALVRENISTISKIKSYEKDRVIIGGGGIYNLEIAKRYIEAGADYLSLSTILINPFKCKSLIDDLLKYQEATY